MPPDSAEAARPLPPVSEPEPPAPPPEEQHGFLRRTFDRTLDIATLKGWRERRAARKAEKLARREERKARRAADVETGAAAAAEATEGAEGPSDEAAETAAEVATPAAVDEAPASDEVDQRAIEAVGAAVAAGVRTRSPDQAATTKAQRRSLRAARAAGDTDTRAESRGGKGKGGGRQAASSQDDHPESGRTGNRRRGGGNRRGAKSAPVPPEPTQSSQPVEPPIGPGVYAADPDAAGLLSLPTGHLEALPIDEPAPVPAQPTRRRRIRRGDRSEDDD
jgi:hypothetical protein